MPAGFSWVSKASKAPAVAVRRLSTQSNKQHDYVRRYYAPLPTRTPFLVSILLFVLGCIAVIEVAFRLGSTVDPKAAAAKTKPAVASATHLNRRQEDCVVTDLEVIYGTSGAGGFVPTSTGFSPGPAGTGEACITVTETTTSIALTTAVPSSDYIDIDGSPVTDPAVEAAPNTPDAPEPCTVTKTIVQYVAESPSTPWSTNIVDPGDAGSTCVTITMTVTSLSYIDIATPTPDPNDDADDGTDDDTDGDGGDDDCVVTQTVEIEVTAYSDAGSAIPVATSSRLGLLPEEGCSTVTVTNIKTKYILIDTPETDDSQKPSSTQIPESYINKGTPTTTTTPGAYVVNATPENAKPGSSYSYITLAETRTSASGDYVVIATPSPSSGTKVGSAAPGEYVTITGASGETLVAPAASQYAVVTTDASGALVPVQDVDLEGGQTGTSPQEDGGNQLGAANGATPISTFVQNGETYIMYASPVATAVITDGPQYVTVIAVPAETSATSAATATSKPEVLAAVDSSALQLSHKFDEYDYFYASYLGVFLAVLLNQLWAVVFCHTKSMEPFYQLHRPEGASAEDSLLANYLSTWLSWRSFRAMFGGQPVMLLVTLTYGLIATLSPIATETMKVQATAWCEPAPKTYQPCAPLWLLDQRFGRTLQAMLSIIAFLITLLIIVNLRRRSGVFSNPTSIAALASLLNHDETLEELRSLDPNTPTSHLSTLLRGQRFRLDYHQTSTGTHHYGLLHDDSPLSQHPKYSTLPNPTLPTRHPHAPSPNHTSRLLRDALFLLWLLTFLALLLAYYLSSTADAFNRFFASGAFGPRFVLVAVAVLTSFHWKTIEREVRVLTPYRRLAKRDADARKTVLVELAGTPVTGLWGSVMRGEVFAAVVAGTSVAGDVLVVMVAGVPFGRGQVWEGFLASFGVSVGVLGWMVLVLIGVGVWRVGNERLGMGPREPDTVLGVLLGLCNEGNGVRRVVEGTECLSRKEREVVVKEFGGRFFAGWVRGGLGEEPRWVVEREGEGRMVERFW